MPAASPRVSIGIPVYNGERYLRQTIESILAQTYTDFELIICDNASTDQTQAICEQYRRADPRVRYCRHDRNLGPARNYNACFELARGELFKWQAADDVIAPDFVEKCVAMLDRDPSLVSVYTRTILIDEHGRPIGKYNWDLELDHPSPVVRFARMVFVNHRRHNAHEFWGVTRAATLRRTPMKGSFPSADRILMSWWTLLGKMGRVEEYLFFNREHQQRSQLATPPRERRPGSRLSRVIGGGPTPPYEWWDASKRGSIVFPEWRWVWEYLRAARHAPVTKWQRAGALAAMAGLYIKFAPRLLRDVLIAAELLLYRALSKTHLTAPAPDHSPKPVPGVHVLPRRAA